MAVSAVSTSTHGSVADAGDDSPPWSFAQQADRPLGVGLADPFQQRVEVGAAQHRSGEQREQFGLLRRAPGFAGPARRTVDQGRHGHGDRQQHHDGDGAVGLGDGEGVPGCDQEVVEQQPGEQRRQCGRGDAAEQCDDEHADEEQRALAADAEERVEQRDDQRTDGDGTTRAASQDVRCRWRGDSRDREKPSRACLVGDHVDVDLARLLHR